MSWKWKHFAHSMLMLSCRSPHLIAGFRLQRNHCMILIQIIINNKEKIKLIMWGNINKFYFNLKEKILHTRIHCWKSKKDTHKYKKYMHSHFILIVCYRLLIKKRRRTKTKERKRGQILNFWCHKRKKRDREGEIATRTLCGM